MSKEAAHVLSDLIPQEKALLAPFVDEILVPVVGERYQYLHMVHQTVDKGWNFRLQLIVNRTQVATYALAFDSSAQITPEDLVELPYLQMMPGPLITGGLRLPLVIPESLREKYQDQLRSLIRSDGLLHPHFQDLNGRFGISDLQRSAVRNLWDFDRAQQENPSGIRLGLVMPAGTGRHEVAMHYIRAVERAEHSIHQILIVTSTTQELDSWRQRLERSWGSLKGQILDIDRGWPYRPDARVVLMTAATFLERQRELAEAGFRFKRRFILADQTEPPLVQTLARKLPRGSRLLYLSPDLMRDQDAPNLLALDGHIHAALSQPGEIEAIAKEIGLADFSRRAMLRAMSAGYLSPIRSYDLVQNSTKNLRAIIEDNRYTLGTLTTVHDRGLILMPSLETARYARDELNVGQEDGKPYRLLPREPEQRAATLAWMREREYVDSHKYLIITRDQLDSIGRELPGINIICLLSNSQDFLPLLVQGAALSTFKPDLRVIDFVGALPDLFAHFGQDGPPPFVRKSNGLARHEQNGLRIDAKAFTSHWLAGTFEQFLHGAQSLEATARKHLSSVASAPEVPKISVPANVAIALPVEFDDFLAQLQHAAGIPQDSFRLLLKWIDSRWQLWLAQPSLKPFAESSMIKASVEFTIKWMDNRRGSASSVGSLAPIWRAVETYFIRHGNQLAMLDAEGIPLIPVGLVKLGDRFARHGPQLRDLSFLWMGTVLQASPEQIKKAFALGDTKAETFLSPLLHATGGHLSSTVDEARATLTAFARRLLREEEEACSKHLTKGDPDAL